MKLNTGDFLLLNIDDKTRELHPSPPITFYPRSRNIVSCSRNDQSWEYDSSDDVYLNEFGVRNNEIFCVPAPTQFWFPKEYIKLTIKRII